MMAMNGKPRGHVWLQWGNWWWRIERPGLVIYRHWAGYLSAAEAGDAVRLEMDRRQAMEGHRLIEVTMQWMGEDVGRGFVLAPDEADEAKRRLSAARRVANTHYAG